jgi:hypothetical protein
MSAVPTIEAEQRESDPAPQASVSSRSMLMRRVRDRTSQVTQDAGQGHFRVPGLEAVLQRGADLPLGLGAMQSLAEQVGIATEVLNGRERDRVTRALTTARPAADALPELSQLPTDGLRAARARNSRAVPAMLGPSRRSPDALLVEGAGSPAQ